MTETNIKTREADIFSVLREIEAAKPIPAVKEDVAQKTEKKPPDPLLLKDSLERKLKLIDLLDGNGYVSKRDIEEIRQSLNDALKDLDEIIAITT